MCNERLWLRGIGCWDREKVHWGHGNVGEHGEGVRKKRCHGFFLSSVWPCQGKGKREGPMKYFVLVLSALCHS